MKAIKAVVKKKKKVVKKMRSNSLATVTLIKLTGDQFDWQVEIETSNSHQSFYYYDASYAEEKFDQQCIEYNL